MALEQLNLTILINIKVIISVSILPLFSMNFFGKEWNFFCLDSRPLCLTDNILWLAKEHP